MSWEDVIARHRRGLTAARVLHPPAGSDTDPTASLQLLAAPMRASRTMGACAKVRASGDLYAAFNNLETSSDLIFVVRPDDDYLNTVFNHILVIRIYTLWLSVMTCK